MGVFAVDFANDRAFSSELWKSLGFNESDLRADKFIHLLHPDEASYISGKLEAVEQGRSDNFSETLRIRDRENGWRWVNIRFMVMQRDKLRKPLYLIGHTQDVSRIKLAEMDSLERLNEIETIRQVSSDLSTSLDLQETVNLILKHSHRVIPYDKASVQLLQGNWLQVIGCQGFFDREATLRLKFKYPVKRSPSTLALQSRKPVICNKLSVDFPDFMQVPGEEPVLSWMGIPLIANNEVIGLLALDSTSPDFYCSRHLQMAEMFASHVAMAIEKASLYEDMQNMAITDSLTGARNRHSLRIHGNFAFEKARRNGRYITMLMIDLDHFKEVNDRFGHDTGDDILTETARLIATCLRPNDLFIRYGGEEFLIILYDTMPIAGYEIAERIRMAICNKRFSVLKDGISTSIGVFGGVPQISDSFSSYISHADAALYQAKEKGRNRVINSCIDQN
ncbi:MAG: diguanylate cyclase [Spirochaetes bacterium]|nr:diguanylate cyclase [Spirochaetota bacterium]